MKQAGAGGSGLRGRYLVALWLVGFLAVAAVVQYRQTRAHQTAREWRALEATRGALEVTKASLDASVHEARGRSVLVPLAQRRLGLRLPQDSEIVILQDPRPR